MTQPAPNRRQRLAGFDSIYLPNRVLSPTVTYSGHDMALDYRSLDASQWVRVVFDRYDAHRVCRGEANPYSFDSAEDPYAPMCVIRSSSWLHERFEYENKHYGPWYDATEMLDEFEHYIFSFHDQFVEVIAGGAHFEFQETLMSDGALTQVPSWTRLPEEATTEQLDAMELPLLLSHSSEPTADIISKSTMADQVYMQVELPSDTPSGQPFLRVTVRTRDGQTTTRLRHRGGKIIATFEGLPSDPELRSAIDAQIDELRARRASRNT